MTRALINATDILGFKDLQKALARTATNDDEMGILQERAVSAIHMAMDLEIENDKQLTDEALCGIAKSVVSTLDAKDAALSGYQHMVSWFGPAGVPDQMPSLLQEIWKGSQPTPKATPELTPQIAAKLQADAQSVALADQAVMDAEEVLKDVGRLEGVSFMATVADIAAAQIFEKIKKNRAYKNLPYTDSDGNRRHVADLEEFCSAFLGKSARRVRELSANLHVLGSDLYESAERIGFRARDYRALKALPAEDQEAVKAVLADEGTKEQAVDLLQDMAERHAAQKAAAQKEAFDLRADLEARDQLMADKTERLDKLSIELEKLKSLPPAKRQRLILEREAAAAEKLDSGQIKASASVNAWLAEVADVLEAEEVSTHTSDYAANLVRYFAEQVAVFVANYGIAVDFEGVIRPEWTRELATQGDE